MTLVPAEEFDMSTEIRDEKTRRVPTPLYAAAGAGDLAYQQLRKLPARANELRGRVGELRGRVGELRGKVAELKPAVSEAVSEQQLRSDIERLREAARRNAAAFVSGAQAAQERAAAVYEDLVARGERVVRTVRTEAAEEVAPAPIEAPTTPLAVDAAPAAVAEPTEAEPTEAKPTEVKPARTATRRTRPAASTKE